MDVTSLSKVIQQMNDKIGLQPQHLPHPLTPTPTSYPCLKGHSLNYYESIRLTH